MAHPYDESAPWRDLEDRRPRDDFPAPRRLQLPDPQLPVEKPRCPKCGMQLAAVMGYVCGDFHCPTFPKVIC